MGMLARIQANCGATETIPAPSTGGKLDGDPVAIAKLFAATNAQDEMLNLTTVDILSFCCGVTLASSWLLHCAARAMKREPFMVGISISPVSVQMVCDVELSVLQLGRPGMGKAFFAMILRIRFLVSPGNSYQPPMA
jgi:hypothetical protein